MSKCTRVNLRNTSTTKYTQIAPRNVFECNVCYILNKTNNAQKKKIEYNFPILWCTFLFLKKY